MRNEISRRRPKPQKAKARLCKLIKAIGCKFIDTEYEYPNPFYPDYPWRFDIFCIYHGRHIAIEIDGKVGHSSKKAKDKRDGKKKIPQPARHRTICISYTVGSREASTT